jgi:RND family efflux transporter MFP subunit
MIELVLAVYGLICWLLFKKFKLVPINDYTVVTAVLIPVLGIGVGFLVLNMLAPVAKDVRLYAPSTSIIAQVTGYVAEVPVKANTPLAKGDVLLRIDDTAYRARLAQVEAQLALAKLRVQQTSQLVQSGAGSAFDQQQFEAEVARLTGARDEARFNLANCTITAPAAGMVTQVLVRPGQFVAPIPFAQVMTFIHAERIWVGAFPQPTLQGIDPGDQAEIALDSAPGHVFNAKVVRVLPALAEGTLSASGQLVRGAYDAPAGRVPVLLEITDPRVSQLTLPVGSAATATIFTNDSHILSLIRGIIMRIHSWENWIFA